MMRSTGPVLVALALSLTACASRGPERRPTVNSGQWMPQGSGSGTTGAASPWGSPAPGATWGPLLGLPFNPPPGGRNAFMGVFPVDVAALQSIQGLVKCAPKLMAPDTWITLDCGQHQAVTKAFAFTPPTGNFLTGPLPPDVDHRVTGVEGPVKNQGAVGACTAFSLSTAMDNAVRRLGRQEVVAPLHVWSKYAVPVMGVAGDRTVDENVTTEDIWPYDPAKACKLLRVPFDSCGRAYRVSSGTGAFDPQLRAEQAAADMRGRYRLAAVEQLRTQPANVQELAAVLAGGDDVWASFWVDSEAWQGRGMVNGVIPDYVQREDEGHAVVLAGYRTVNGAKQFLIHNSWGERWGDRGYGWISEAMVVRHLRSAYKIRIAEAGAPGLPKADPGGGGCSGGQVRDLVLGTCAAVCPSGSAPAAGVCLPAAVPGLPAPGQPPGGKPSACPQGQAPDAMTGQCVNLCPGGVPSIGGMCLPVPR
jgi:Papain family cysteine protease